MGISPGDAWDMTLSEVGALMAGHRETAPVYGKLTLSDIDELKEFLDDGTS